MRVDVYKKWRRRCGTFFDKEIIGNRAEGAKKNSAPPPLGPKKKFWPPLFGPIKNFAQVDYIRRFMVQV